MPTNPNQLTLTRIPNAISAVVGAPTDRSRYSLRRVNYDNIPDYLAIGIRKRKYQYDGTFRSGLTPGDNGYLNDGGAYSTSSDAPSRFYISSPFEWWNDYVIYCYDNHADFLEIYTADSITSLNNIVRSLNLNPSGVTLTEYECLYALGKNELLCVNTHYPDITPNRDSVPTGHDEFVDNLVLLIDFGFIPCYPRGGTASYDISGNTDNTMVLIGSSGSSGSGGFSYVGSGLSSCGGGALELLSGAYGSIPYRINGVNSTRIFINTWVRLYNISSPKDQYIIYNWDDSAKKGYYLYLENSTRFTLVVGDGNVYQVSTKAPITSNRWYNIMCEIFDGNITITLSDRTIFAYDDVSSSGAYQPNNTRDFLLGTSFGGFSGLISLISIYDYAYTDKIGLWESYTNTYPNRYS